MTGRILIIEDELNLADVLKYVLSQEGYMVECVSDGRDGADLMTGNEYEVVICDIRLPGLNGFEILRHKNELNLNCSFIMITAYGSVEDAVKAIKNGADEYITKPFLNEDLVLKVNRIMKYREIERQNKLLRTEVSNKYSGFNGIIGKSDEMIQIFDLIKKIAKYDSPVLIYGASGTGKELFAKAIHYNSPRCNNPFVAINCGAVPEGLLESEFYGYCKGAFTGAQSEKKGLFEQAEGGTLFLDEISEMGLNLQVKLLRVLQENEIRRLGDIKTKKINIRFIASTNKILEKEIEKRTFREDLYYRLNVVEIKIPPLSNRKEDIPLLIEHFIGDCNKRFGKSIKDISEKALDILLNYNWPGNVRELEHVIQRAIVLCEEDIIQAKHIDSKINNDKEALKIEVPDNNFDLKKLLNDSKKSIETQLIEKALEVTNNNRTEAAKLLGISHRALMYKINDYEI
ncbi:MAG: sigma-54 dependent transcriptional regulator [Bacillota bacterium]|nr:sigma-54 dependent transcriptional regulator [Bacillota bacterium]MDD3298191.1 sigma-54 dependent transcriptional regulator [Bacillota bacterium]MDD3851518.1 sigma-54 dependent transcriptional regulator [Bacillota bacterium]MDD4707051.1 sigma-54 dependent transcriptional regulator [Bacillota bacterium]